MRFRTSLLIIALLCSACCLLAIIATAGEREELLANQKAINFEWAYLQERARTISIDAQAIQGKLDAIAKAEADKKEPKNEKTNIK